MQTDFSNFCNSLYNKYINKGQMTKFLPPFEQHVLLE